MAEPAVDADTIRVAVDILYKRMLADPAVAEIFAHTEMRRLRAHQRMFLLRILGGPGLYSGRDMKIAHAGLHLTDDQFAVMVGHLLASLSQAGLAPGVVARAAVDVEALRPLIVEPQAGAG